jgi:quercetin dioxygenase-like cupin family protein
MQLIRAAHKLNTPSKQPTETFTGTVHMDPIFTADDCMGNNVCFTPGARTFWHTHERGQILTVTIGTGFVCAKGEAPRKLLVGDVVHVPAGETHWHGATKGTIMAHMAISLGSKSRYVVLIFELSLTRFQKRLGGERWSRRSMIGRMRWRSELLRWDKSVIIRPISRKL